MRILMAASVPFESMRRRQQQVALGLAERGHEILYLNPPRPFRSLVDPARFELQELELGGSAPAPAESEIAAAARVAGIKIREQGENLRVAEKGVAVAGMERWGWTTRAGWKHWASEVQHVIRSLAAEGEDVHFAPDLILCYHPALIGAIREAFPGRLVFDLLDDFPTLASSRAIAAAFETALTEGIPQADGLLAVNRYLLESWGRLAAKECPRAVVEHGVDLTLFRPPDESRSRAIRTALEIPAERKMICYLGRFDARISYEDVQTLIGLEEQATFLFVGEVSVEGRPILQRLPSKRIMPVGPLRPEQAAEIVAAANVLILPFRREPHLEAARGLKLYEYLATGRPIVASFRRTLKAFREMLYLYTTREELQEAFRTALAEPDGDPVQALRTATACDAGWDRRVAEMEAFLESIPAR